MTATRFLLVAMIVSGLLGCTTGEKSGGGLHLGADGSFHPDGTAGIANYTGQGDSGEGWAGDSEGEGGPSAEKPVANDRVPH
jgi:hypothetical protein